MQLKPNVIGLVSALALALPAYAQQENSSQPNQPGANQASECLESLETLARRMNEEGYWLAGYSGYGIDAFGNAYPTRNQAGGTTPGAGAQGTVPAPEGNVAPPGTGGTTPWAGLNWGERPHFEIRTLYRAANVLATSGNEEACLTVLNAAEQRYDDYTNQLAEFGLDSQEIMSWRQAEIAAAVPVSETTYPRRVDHIIGTDVRNPQDEDLGDIEDIVLDPETGDIRYAVISRGGFLGIGSEQIAVPWEHLYVAPGMSTFVLPVDEAAMEQAPRVERETLENPGQTGAVDQEEIASYWEQRLKG